MLDELAVAAIDVRIIKRQHADGRVVGRRESGYPLKQAMWSGVQPMTSLRFTSALHISTSWATISRYPRIADQCNGVKPSRSASSISAPAFSKRRNRALLPMMIVLWSGANSDVDSRLLLGRLAFERWARAAVESRC